MRRLALPLILLLSCLGTALAHPMDEWFLNLKVEGPQVRGVLRVPADQVVDFEASPLVLKGNAQTLELSHSRLGDDQDGRVEIEISGTATKPLQELTLSVPGGLLDENQSVVGFLTVGSQEPTTLLVGPGSETTLSVKPEDSVERPQSVSGFFKLGVTHIVEGYDHLLFLFCLLIAGGTIRHFLVVVTSFTLGHSVTLALSVLGFISLPSQLTETIIALSIVVAALLNVPLLRHEQAGEKTSSITSRGVLAGGFGLIHGLGFAGILKEIGIEGSGVAAPLLGFNLGVEAGQLVLVAIFFPVLMAINKTGKRVTILTACSYLAALIGSYWVVERLGLL